MNLLSVLIIVLIVLALSGSWGYRAGWPGAPYYGVGFGGVGLVLVILLILVLLGRI